MKIKQHIAFRANDVPLFVDYLLQNNISFQHGEIISLDIYDSDPHWNAVSKYVEQYQLFNRSEAIYSKDELCSAAWMQIWCKWRFGYPQPENTFLTDSSTYSREEYCRNCGCGEKQIGDFRIKSVPKWGKRHFGELEWIGDELFLNEKAKYVLESSDISGVSFRTVKNKRGTETLQNVYQLVIPHIVEKGMIAEQSALREVYTCPICGKTKYLCSSCGMLTYRKEVFDNVPDVVKTAEVFGSMKNAVRHILIRQNVYQTIIANHLEHNLVFEPINLL